MSFLWATLQFQAWTWTFYKVLYNSTTKTLNMEVKMKAEGFSRTAISKAFKWSTFRLKQLSCWGGHQLPINWKKIWKSVMKTGFYFIGMKCHPRLRNWFQSVAAIPRGNFRFCHILRVQNAASLGRHGCLLCQATPSGVGIYKQKGGFAERLQWLWEGTSAVQSGRLDRTQGHH